MEDHKKGEKIQVTDKANVVCESQSDSDREIEEIVNETRRTPEGEALTKQSRREDYGKFWHPDKRKTRIR